MGAAQDRNVPRYSSRRRQATLARNALQHGLFAVGELTNRIDATLNEANAIFVQTARLFFAVARDERHRVPAIEELHHGFDLDFANLQVLCDPRQILRLRRTRHDGHRLRRQCRHGRRWGSRTEDLRPDRSGGRIGCDGHNLSTRSLRCGSGGIHFGFVDGCGADRRIVVCHVTDLAGDCGGPTVGLHDHRRPSGWLTRL